MRMAGDSAIIPHVSKRTCPAAQRRGFFSNTAQTEAAASRFFSPAKKPYPAPAEQLCKCVTGRLAAQALSGKALFTKGKKAGILA